MKLKRSERIVVMTEYLLNNPNKLIPLTYFVTKFNQAKSSISEDIHIIKTGFKEENIGEVKTLAGVSGGVIFTPTLVEEDARKILDEFIEKISMKTEDLTTKVVKYILDRDNNSVIDTEDVYKEAG